MQPSKLYAIIGVVTVTLIVVLAIVFFRSSSNLTEIPTKDFTKCDGPAGSAKMPTSLMVGPCESYDAGQCKLKASLKDFEIKATFPGAVITDKATAKLFWVNKEVVSGDACQAGFTCPENDDKKKQSLDWKSDVKGLQVNKDKIKLQVDDAKDNSIYCVQFNAEVVA